MRFYTSASLLFLALRATAQDADEEIEPPTQSPTLNVQIKTSFPSSEIFGIKLINGLPTTALLSIHNAEPSPITVIFVGGSLWTDPLSTYGVQNIRNLTTTRYNVEIPPGEGEDVSYSFTTELHPQELKLQLAAVVTDGEGKPHTLQAFSETVGVVEREASLLDPQMLFLYFFLAVTFLGTLYFIYSTWITTLFPQQRGKGKGGERARKSTHGSKKVDPSEQVAVLGADGPAVASGAKAYDESWIPAHHINTPRKGARKSKSKE